MHHAKPLLLVEDNSDNTPLLQRALQDLGIAGRVVRVPSAEEALVRLHDPAQEKPALILLDLRLPGMSGTEFLQAVKSDPALAPIPVVVLTTSQERRDIQQSFDRHAAGYVVKPVDYAATVGALRIIENYWSLSYLPACHT